jgi:hypothetical protein
MEVSVMPNQAKKYPRIEDVPFLRDEARYGGAVQDPAFLTLAARPLQTLVGLALALQDAELVDRNKLSPELRKQLENTTYLQPPNVFRMPGPYVPGRAARWLAKRPKLDRALKVLVGGLAGLDEYFNSGAGPRASGPDSPDMNP